MKSRSICLMFSILLVMFTITGCVDIPSEFFVDLEVDTGRDLKNLMDATMEDLHRAEELAGGEARKTIQEAIDELLRYTEEVDAIFGARLDRTISSLDAVVQAKLLWIQSYTEQVHGYALDIIHATGEEARSTIEEATKGILRAISDAELAAQRTTVVAIRGVLLLVDSVAERTLTMGGMVAGLLLTFTCAFGWGRLIYQRRIPSAGVQRSLALGLMAVSFTFSLAPFTMLIAPVRAYALRPAGKATALELPTGRPSVYYFDPDPLVVPIVAPTPRSLSVEGSSLTAMGKPTVTFGNSDLEITGYTEHEIKVDIGAVLNDPVAAGRVDVQFGSGPEAVQYAVPVWTAVPEPTLVKVPNVANRTVEQARADLADEGLSVAQVLTEPHMDISKGRVTRSEPDADRQVESGSSVTLYVSTGKPIIAVPRVENRPLGEAKAKISAEGLTLGQVIEESHERVERGAVIRSDPIAGTEVEWGSKVTLYVSRGQVCRVKQHTPRLKSVTYHPPLMEGDREFDGHGPKVTVRVEIHIDDNKLLAEIHMSALETEFKPYPWFDFTVEGDTKAYGTQTVILWRPDPGQEIRRLIDKSSSSHTYIDDDHDLDSYGFYGLDELVERFEIIGDTKGDDVGDDQEDTGVTVIFNPDWEVELIETVDCVAARVGVSLTEIAIDEVPCRPPLRMSLDFNISGGRRRWPLTIKTFEAPTTYPINERFETILTEHESLTISVNGSAVECFTLFGAAVCPPVAPVILAGYFQREFAPTDEWGRGNHSARSDVIPFYYTVRYTIDVDWLP